MDVRHLRYLLAVAEERSFAAAARKLGITQQALGQSVSTLETELGVKLFERGSGTEPTVYGRALLKHAAIVDTEMQRAQSALQQLKEATAGEVRIGVGESFAGYVAPLAIGWMHKRNPGVKIHIVEDYTRPLLERLESGELDFVASAPAINPPVGSEIVQEVLGDTHDVVFARASHPLAKRKELPVSELQAYTWLVPSDIGEVYETVLETFIDEGVPPPSRLIWCDGTGTGIALLLNNDYLILVAPAMVASFRDAGLVVQLNVPRPRRKRRMCLWTRKNGVPSPAAVALISDVRLAAQQIVAPSATAPIPRRGPGSRRSAG